MNIYFLLIRMLIESLIINAIAASVFFVPLALTYNGLIPELTAGLETKVVPQQLAFGTVWLLIYFIGIIRGLTSWTLKKS